MRVLREAIDVIETATAKGRVEEGVPVEGEIPIEVLGLSTRVHNSLDRAGIATVEEILGIGKKRFFTLLRQYQHDTGRLCFGY